MSLRDKRAWILGGAAAAALAWYVTRYPWSGPPLDLALLSLPTPGKLWRAFTVLGWWILFNAAVMGFGGPLRKWILGDREGDLRVPQTFALGCLALSYLTLACAALHLLIKPLLLTLLVLPACVALLMAWRSRAATIAWLRNLPRGPLVICAVLAANPVLAAFVPEYGWDAFVYHLAIPERYLFSNGIWLSPFSVYSAFPHTVEMLYLYPVALDAVPLAKLIHLEFGLMAAWVVYSLATRASRRAGWLALVIVAADSLFLWELERAYSDLAATLFGLLAVAALLDSRDGRTPRWPCGVWAGAALSVRYTAGTLLLAVLVGVWLSRIGRDWRERLAASLEIGLAAVLIMLPWLARDLVFTGNPVSPALQGIFHSAGHEFFPPIVLQQLTEQVRGVGMGRDLLALLGLPWNLTMRAKPGVYESFGFQIGCLYLLGAALCLLQSDARRNPMARVLLPLIGVLVLLWFFTVQEPRYLLPALALVAVVGGIGWDSLLTSSGRWKPLWLLLPAVALFHIQVPQLLLGSHAYGYALGGRSVADFESQEPALVVARQLRGMMKPQDCLLMVFEGRGFFFAGLDYIPHHAVEGGSPVLQLIHNTPETELAAKLEQLGVTHILVNTQWVSPTVRVEGYGEQELQSDLAKLSRFLTSSTTLVLADRGVYVGKL